MTGLGPVRARTFDFPYRARQQHDVAVARFAAPLGLASFPIVARCALCWPPGCENPVRQLPGIRITDCVAEDANAAPLAFCVLDTRHFFVSKPHAGLRLLGLS